MIEAVILAGGLGTRLRSAVSDVPKPMAPINGKPFLDLLLYDLSQKGIKRVVLSLGYMANIIQDYFGKKKYDIEIIYNIEESPLGTGGAIYSSLKLCNDEGILVLNGDSYIGFDLSALKNQWSKYKKPVIVTRLENPSMRYGNILLEKDKIRSFSNQITNTKTNKVIINAGVYILPKNILNHYSDGDVFSFELDYLPCAVKNEQFYAIKSDDYFIDIGIPSDFKKAQTELAKNIYND